MEDQSIDFEVPTAEQAEAFENVPAGRYQAVFTEFQKDRTEAGSGIVKVTAQVIAGEHQNRKIWYTLFVSGGTDDGMRGRAIIKQMMEAILGPGNIAANYTQLVNQPVGIEHNINKKGYANLRKVISAAEVQVAAPAPAKVVSKVNGLTF